MNQLVYTQKFLAYLTETLDYTEDGTKAGAFKDDLVDLNHFGQFTRTLNRSQRQEFVNIIVGAHLLNWWCLMLASAVGDRPPSFFVQKLALDIASRLED